MDINFADVNNEDFDPELYIKILIVITKADRNNGAPEIEYIKTKANSLGLDFNKLWNTTDKKFSISRLKVSRFTAFVILKDCIMLANLDKSYSLSEKEKVYTYAQKLDIPRSDVHDIEKWLDEYNVLLHKWDKLVFPDKY
jgi:hypothetical protein